MFIFCFIAETICRLNSDYGQYAKGLSAVWHIINGKMSFACS